MRKIVFAFVMLLVFLVPMENILIFETFGTLSRGIGYFAGGLALISVAADLSLRRLPSAFLILIVYWLWGLLSYGWTMDEPRSLGAIHTSISVMVFAWMIFEFAQTYRQQMWLLRSYYFGCVISLIILFAGYVTLSGAWWASKMRYSALGINVNYLADMLMYCIPIAIYLASRAPESIRMLYWLYVPAASIGVLLSGSRVIGVTLVVLLGLVAMKSLRARWLTIVMVVACVVTSVILIPRLVPTHLMDRVLSVGEFDVTDSNEGRIGLWQRGWEVFQKYPINGVGICAYGMVTIGTPGFPAHNVFLGILVETGLIGLMLYLPFYVMLGYGIRKLPSAERTLWTQVYIVWTLIALTAPNEYTKSTWFLYGIILGQIVYFRSLQSQMKQIPMGWRQFGRQVPGMSG